MTRAADAAVAEALAQVAALEQAMAGLSSMRRACSGAALICHASPSIFGDPRRLAPTFAAIDRHLEAAQTLIAVAREAVLHEPVDDPIARLAFGGADRLPETLEADQLAGALGRLEAYLLGEASACPPRCAPGTDR
jgi:hypothetical protein